MSRTGAGNSMSISLTDNKKEKLIAFNKTKLTPQQDTHTLGNGGSYSETIQINKGKGLIFKYLKIHSGLSTSDTTLITEFGHNVGIALVLNYTDDSDKEHIKEFRVTHCFYPPYEHENKGSKKDYTIINCDSTKIKSITIKLFNNTSHNVTFSNIYLKYCLDMNEETVDEKVDTKTALNIPIVEELPHKIVTGNCYILAR
jgi:hypothetical protein